MKMKRVTVGKAIQKGHLMVNLPVFTIMLLGFALTFYIEGLVDNGWIFPFGFIGTFVLMWLWWSVMIVRWRILVFEQCRNVHELKRRAISAGLIWPDGSWFEKTEIRSRKQQQKLKILENKFQAADDTERGDDASIPSETKIYHSKLSLGISWFSGTGLIVYGIYAISEGDITGYIFMIVACFILYQAIKKSKIRKPYLILSEKGIKTLKTPFISWEDIAYIETSFDSSRWSLTWRVNQNKANGNSVDEIDLSDLSMSPKKIDTLVKVYQQRHKNSNRPLSQ